MSNSKTVAALAEVQALQAKLAGLIAQVQPQGSGASFVTAAAANSKPRIATPFDGRKSSKPKVEPVLLAERGDAYGHPGWWTAKSDPTDSSKVWDKAFITDKRLNAILAKMGK